MSNLIPTLRYLASASRHKWFVFQAGLWTRAPLWRLITHDLSKFSLAEAPHYGRQFFGEDDDPEGFARAWLHHQNVNDHHWEYWIPRTAHRTQGGNDGEPLPMPEAAIREMIADWIGASRTYTGKWPVSVADWPWFEKAWPRIKLHPDTRWQVMEILDEVFPGTILHLTRNVEPFRRRV